MSVVLHPPSREALRSALEAVGEDMHRRRPGRDYVLREEGAEPVPGARPVRFGSAGIDGDPVLDA